jgi:CysZ protein
MLAWTTSDDILSYFTRKYPINDFNTDIGSLFKIVVSIGIRGFTFFIYLKLFRYLVLILLSPVFANISNALFVSAEHHEHNVNIWYYCFCSFRGIKIALRNFILELMATILLTLMSLLVLWIFPLIPFLILLVESYFFGAVLMDYRFEKDELTIHEGIKKSRALPGVPIGIGIIFNLILLIPLIGVMFGPVLALIAAHESVRHINHSNSDVD